MSDFVLHRQLKADTHVVCDLEICRVLLMNDRRFTWLILVPMLIELTELHEISASVGHKLWDEIAHVSSTLQTLTGAAKMNVAALGNQVPQLHIHVIARNPDDAAWPNPVWGHGTAESYTASAASELIDKLTHSLSR